MKALWLLAGLAAGIAAAVGAAAPPTAPLAGLAAPLERAALQTPRALHAVTLGLARAGNRLVAVGERGVVLLSDDSGRQWRQVPVPVSVSLTAVRFADERTGWAIGHAGVVLHTRDGGEHWQRQLDGVAIIHLLQQAAGGDPAQQRAAEQFAADGPDKPLLGLLVRSASELWVVGAYGLALRSTDGGQHWVAVGQRLENPRGLHLNAIAARGDTIVVAGEQGLVRLSRDGGQHFTALDSPYNGSLFSAQLPPDGSVAIAGLRGHVFRAADEGARFEPVRLPVPATINASVLLPDGGIAFGHQAGGVVTVKAPWQAGAALVAPPVPLLAALALAPDGTLVAGGAFGPVRLATATTP